MKLIIVLLLHGSYSVKGKQIDDNQRLSLMTSTYDHVSTKPILV
jgi:hypothetical protein